MSPRELCFLTFLAHTWAVFMQARVYLILCNQVMSVISLGAVIMFYNQSVRLKVFKNGSSRKPVAPTYVLHVAVSGNEMAV